MKKVFPILIMSVAGAGATDDTRRVRAEVMTRTTLMPGTAFQTSCYTKQGEQPGPAVVIIGGMHGDEAAGYLAARRLVQWRVMRGTLILIPDGNPPAIKRNIRQYKINMNALFPGDPQGDEAHRAAHALWKVVVIARPSLLLTLHESRGFHATNPNRYGQTFTYDFKALTPFMERVRLRLNPDIPQRKYRFLNFVEEHPTCPTYQAWRHLQVPATSIETTRTLPLQLRVRHQLMAVQAFLDEVGMEYTSGDLPRLSTRPRPAPARLASRSARRAAKRLVAQSPTPASILTIASTSAPASTSTPLPTIRPGDISLAGRVISTDVANKKLMLKVTHFSLPNGRTGILATPREKAVAVNGDTIIHAFGQNDALTIEDVQVGDAITVIGPDAGSTHKLTARAIVVGKKE